MNPLLSIRDLGAWYGSAHVLQGVTLGVATGEVVALIGRNGAGKTTTLKSVMGLMGLTRGSVSFDGEEILPWPAHTRYQRGIAYVPEERRIVPGLTVLENLRLGLLNSTSKAEESVAIEEIAATFPRLKQRLAQQAVTMSGGEQQMLAIARALIAKPRIVLLDEPSEGIMPVLVDEMFELFARLKTSGMTLLLVEQNVELALTLADRAYVLEQGCITLEERADLLLARPDIQERYCAV